jgi:mRNA interferase RelE/StbE
MNIARTERFKKAWKQLAEEDKNLAKKAIENLLRDIGYPGLRVKRIKGVKDIWEARASLSLRITFQIEKGTIVLRNIGKHDETIEKP